MAIFKKKTPKAIEQEKKFWEYHPEPRPISPGARLYLQLRLPGTNDRRRMGRSKLSTELLQRNAQGLPTHDAVKLATQSVNCCGFNLERAVVISEAEYYDGYTIPCIAHEVVFVLPNLNRVSLHPSGNPLLETAKLLMATTPNGI